MQNLPSKLPNIPAVEAFLVAAESKSFSDAARKLKRTPAALSQQISALEKMAGQDLFRRATKGKDIQLTPAGRRYLDRVQSVIFRLAPSFINQDPAPSIREIDFDTGIRHAHPDIVKFWEDAKAIDFDLTKDRVKAHALRNVSLSFRQEYGQWVYNHVGRRTAFFEFHQEKFCKDILGKNASVRQPSGRYDAFEYEVTKIYNVVARSGDPSLSVVDAMVSNNRDQKRHAHYERIVLQLLDETGPVIYSRIAMKEDAPTSDIEGTEITGLSLAQIGQYSSFLSDFLDFWRLDSYWGALESYHQYFFVCRPSQIDEGLTIFHVGERHGSLGQFGRVWKDSAVAAPFTEDRIGDDYNLQTSRGYYSVLENGKPQLDLIRFQGLDGEKRPTTIVYVRLLVRAYLADGSPIVINVANVPQRFGTKTDADQFVSELTRG